MSTEPWLWATDEGMVTLDPGREDVFRALNLPRWVGVMVRVRAKALAQTREVDWPTDGIYVHGRTNDVEKLAALVVDAIQAYWVAQRQGPGAGSSGPGPWRA